jgi:hygromycin-B 4-O-kinase
MRQTQAVNIDSRQAQAFLAEHFDAAAAAVEPIGEGAWSRCFGFRRGDEELAIRFGRYGDDFLKDQRAYAYATPDLPIPQVHKIGRAFDGYYAISTRVHGAVLEGLDTAHWRRVAPAVAAALEAMRTADLSATQGFGGWGAEGTAPHATWPAHLLTVGNDTPQQRTHGWRARLASSAEGEAAFTWGFALLQQVGDDAVPRSLIHADLINRNVLAGATGLAGVFDWGCSCYGDHLYDLAWFEFWAPWHPNLDIPTLRAELAQRWDAVGYRPPNQTARLQACYLHIGLDHLAYNAWLGDWATLAATAERMRVLVESA